MPHRTKDVTLTPLRTDPNLISPRNLFFFENQGIVKDAKNDQRYANRR